MVNNTMMGKLSATVEINPIKLNRVIELVFVRIRYKSSKPNLQCKCNAHFLLIVLDFNGLY